MSQVENFIETTNKLVYTVPDPTNWTEVHKALEMILGDLKARGIDTNWDDTVTVESDGQSIRFVAELPDGQIPSMRPAPCNLEPCVLPLGHSGGCRT